MTTRNEIDLDHADGVESQAREERDLCEEVEAYVVTRPWRALSIALAVGFVIGRFIL